MAASLLTPATLAMVMTVVLQVWTIDPECTKYSAGGRSLSLSINSKVNNSGNWMTFSSITDSTSSPEDVNIDVKQSVIECEGKTIIKIDGTARDKNGKFVDRLTFSPKAGTNVAVVNHGRTVVKINSDDILNGVVLTNRPLKDNEVFEVTLEKKGSKFEQSMGIGVTAVFDEILPHLNRVKSGTWMFYSVDAWNNGKKIKESYGKNIYSLVVGDRVGVMRSDKGTLHLFINGIDQGPAASDVPGNLYGAFELFGSALQASITT